MTNIQAVTLVLGRLLMAAIFVSAGYSKIGGYEATQAYMASAGVPGMLLPLVILAELGGGLALLSGLLTRLASVGLAVFTLIAAFAFHANFADQMQQILFMKNLAMAGGLLILSVHGPGRWSLDHLLGWKL